MDLKLLWLGSQNNEYTDIMLANGASGENAAPN